MKTADSSVNFLFVHITGVHVLNVVAGRREGLRMEVTHNTGV